jgi:putative colanic acid biosynthesis acetyltransferase WcaF
MSLDIRGARAARPYSRREYVGRALWMLASPLFRFSPRPMFAWRRFLLRSFGASIGHNAHVYPSTIVEIPWNLSLGDEASIGERVLVYSLGRVEIGARATISHNAHLCAGTHDYRDPALPLLRLPIRIGSEAWVCAQAFVGPGSEIGEGAIVGAGAVVSGTVEPWTIVAGNPAVFVKKRLLEPRGR